MKKGNTSILPDSHSNILEIQGSYWPRILLREQKKMNRAGKSDEKLVTKALRKQGKRKAHCQSGRVECPKLVEALVIAPLCDLRYSPSEVPPLVGEEVHPNMRPHYSPVTGKRIVSIDKHFSRLIPLKNSRRHHSTSRVAKSQTSEKVVAKD